MTRVRTRAPELVGRGGWINTGGEELSLARLRGRIVILDFWTSCCGNCLHVLDELRPIEDRYGEVVTVIGVHSPKFEHERDHATVVAAVERYAVKHPVLDDPDLHTWGQYAARAWPTLAVVDPEGYLVASMAGEGHGPGIARLVDELVVEHDAKGTLRRDSLAYEAPPAPATELRFPTKAVELADGRVLVADTTHRSLAILDGERVVSRIGADAFVEPQGLCVLPAEIAKLVGYDVLVADTSAHLLRGVRLADGEVRVAVDLAAAMPKLTTVTGAVPAVPSPWDLAWWDGAVAVAAAGIHLLLRFDPVTGAVSILAGTTVEGLGDGAALDGWLAQPSGLAATAERLWFVDAETSALRWLDRSGQLHTAVGEGLFDFGHVDGPAADALLQHPLGLAVLRDGSVAVADTYNGAVRRYDPETETVSTLASGLAEPSDILVAGDQILVVESAGHRITAPIAPGVTRDIASRRYEVARPVTDLAAGALTVTVRFEPAPGQELDDRYGPATRLEVTADPAELLVSGAGAGTYLTRELVLSADIPAGVLSVVAQAAACDHGVENPACHLARQDWGVPVAITPDGDTELSLILRNQ